MARRQADLFGQPVLVSAWELAAQPLPSPITPTPHSSTASAASLVKHFRASFNDDSVCTEGLGYWSYGFMHYLSLSELPRLATGGAIILRHGPGRGRFSLWP